MKAVFKGITFYVQSFDVTKELNKANYDYINNSGETIALTKKAEILSLSGFVLNLLSKDLLLQSFKSKSKGTLIHPSLGIMKVVCTKLNIREDADQNGAYFLNLEFIKVEDAKVLGLDIQKSTGSFLSKIHSFLESLSVLHEAILLQNEIIDSFKMLNSFFITRNGFGLLAHSTYDTIKNAYDLKYDVLSLLRSPENLLNSLVTAINTLSKQEKKELQPVVFELIDSKVAVNQTIGEGLALILANSLKGTEQQQYIKYLRFILSSEAYRLSYDIEKNKEPIKKMTITKRPSLVAQYLNKDFNADHEANLFEVSVHA